MSTTRNGYIIGCLIATASCGDINGQFNDSIEAIQFPLKGAIHSESLIVQASGLSPQMAANSSPILLTITGKEMSDRTKVKVGGILASFKSFSPARSAAGNDVLKVTVPARPGFVGTVDVDITEDGDTIRLSKAFRFYSAALKFDKVEFGSGYGQAGLAVFDANGDNATDYAVIHRARREVAVLLGAPGGGVPKSTNWSGTSDAGASFVRTGFYDADLKPDLLVGSAISPQLMLLLGDGSGKFPTQTNVPLDRQADDASAVDLNNDGQLDIVYLTRATQEVTVLFGTALGVFDPPIHISLPGQPSGLAVGDVTGDRLLDLLVSDTSGSIQILEQNVAASFNLKQTISMLSVPRGVALLDVNLDGQLDLVFLSDGVQNVHVLWGQRAGDPFDPTLAVRASAGNDPTAVVGADFDGDGLPDLAVSNQGDDTVSILRQRRVLGSASFLTRGDILLSPGTEPSNLFVTDVNRDNRPDLAVFGQGSVAVSVLKNTSS